MAAQPLSYTDTSYKEPSSWAGSNLQIQNDLILRPRIGGSRRGGSRSSKGGFYPSVMKGVVDGGVYLAPLAALTGRRMFTRKNGGGKKENWTRNRGVAKVSLQRYGKPSAVNVNKYAALKRKDTRKAAEFKRAYIQRKGLVVVKEGKKPRKEQKKSTNKALEAEYKRVQSRRAPAPAADRVKWANQVHAASETLKQFKKKNPGVKRFKGNFMTLASLRRLGMDEKEFFQRYKTFKPSNSDELESNSVSPPRRPSSRRRSRSPPSASRSPPKQPKGTKKNEHKDRALKTLRNLKKTYKNGMARVPGNWAKLATLYRKGDVRGQQAFLKSYGVSDSDVVAATAPLARERVRDRAPIEATRKVNKKVKPSQYTRNQYWAAYRQAGDNLKTQGIVRPKPENKRRLLESRRQGMSMGASAASAAPAPAPTQPRVRVPAPVKGSPVGAENLEMARETLKAVAPEGAAGPSIAQTLQFARMTKNGREANVNRFIETYAARKTATLAKQAATAAKRAARDSSV